MVTLIQGDSYQIPVRIEQDGMLLSPEMVDDLELIIPDVLSRRMTTGGLSYHEDDGMWYFRPTQQETLNASTGTYDVGIRAKYKDIPPSTKVHVIAKIRIQAGPFQEAI